jgi:hypothetical protein
VTARDGGNADFAGAKICLRLLYFITRKERQVSRYVARAFVFLFSQRTPMEGAKNVRKRIVNTIFAPWRV